MLSPNGAFLYASVGVLAGVFLLFCVAGLSAVCVPPLHRVRQFQFESSVFATV